MSAVPKFNWNNFWADLLKGAGNALLVHDGSRLSEAALSGLEVFDKAQEQRRRREREQEEDDARQVALARLPSILSPEEQAAYRQLPPEQQRAWLDEMAHLMSDDVAPARRENLPFADPQLPISTMPPLPRRQPMSPNPTSGWQLQSILPFDSNGSLRVSTPRR